MTVQRYSQEAMIEALRRGHGLKAVAARELGCSRNTVDKYCSKYAAVGDVMREEREAMLDLGEAALFAKVKEGEGWAVCFFLKTQGRERGYIERSETDVTSGGQPISFTLQIAQAVDVDVSSD